MLLRLAFWTVVFGALGWFQATHPGFPIALVPTLAVGFAVRWLWRTGWLKPLIGMALAYWIASFGGLVWGFIVFGLAGFYVWATQDDRNQDIRQARERIQRELRELEKADDRARQDMDISENHKRMRAWQRAQFRAWLSEHTGASSQHSNC